MRIMLKVFLLAFFFFVFSATFVHAQSKKINNPKFFRAEVIKVIDEGVKDVGGVESRYRILMLKFLEGESKDKAIVIESSFINRSNQDNDYKIGENVILVESFDLNGKGSFMIYDKYRIPQISYIAILFFVLVIIVSGIRGIGSLVGLSISFAIIFFFIVPQILSGSDPVAISIVGSLATLIITIYFSHGINKKTTIALFSIFLALGLTAFFANFFVALSGLTGFTEETSTLIFGPTAIINLKGLLLAGIIIGTLGALDDIAITQVSTVFVLAKTDKNLRFGELFRKGFSIGRDHIASMVNTLALAYTGSSLALFLFLILNPQEFPLWVIINSEDISSEIVRTLAGSMGLILAVPITTFLAAFFADSMMRERLMKIIRSFA